MFDQSSFLLTPRLIYESWSLEDVLTMMTANMNRGIVLLLLTLIVSLLTTNRSFATDTQPAKIAIIKADDVRSAHPKWERFIKVSLERGVKVSCGLIGNSLEKTDIAYQQWLKKWSDSKQVEFWHHGWNHAHWMVDGKKLYEFSGSGYEHQKKHLKRTQDAIQSAIGSPFITFGSPNNAMDEDTARALNEMPEIKLVFAYANHSSLQHMKDKIILPMILRGEHDGTGKPNFIKFKKDYLKKKASREPIQFTALQFHPSGFSEEDLKSYTDILEFLMTEGYTFMLPGEYAMLSKTSAAGE